MEFPWYLAIYNYLDSKIYPIDATRNIQRRVREYAKKLEIAPGGKLISRKDGREVLHQVNAEEIIIKVHEEGHLGILNTEYHVNKAYICKGLRDITTKVVQECETCQFRAKMKVKRQNEGVIFKTPKYPFQIIACDAIGPITQEATKLGNKYILTGIDMLTRYPFAKSVPDISEKTTAEFLYEHVVVQFGVPQYCLTDRGSNFKSEYIKTLLQELGCRNLYTTAYRPQTNGCCERLNQSLSWTLAKIARDNGDAAQWDKYVKTALMVLRSTKNASTGHTPCYLLFGYEMRTPRTWVPPREDYVIGEELDALADRIVEIEGKMQEVQKKAIKISDENKRKAKRRYDGQVNVQPKFEVGDKVLLWDNVPAYKLADKWIGPFTVFKVNKNGTYHLTGKNSKRIAEAVNGDKLRPFYESVRMIPDVMVGKAHQQFRSWIAKKEFGRD